MNLLQLENQWNQINQALKKLYIDWENDKLTREEYATRDRQLVNQRQQIEKQALLIRQRKTK